MPASTLAPETAAHAYRLRANGSDFEAIAGILGLRNRRAAYHAAWQGAVAAGDDIRSYGRGVRESARIAVASAVSTALGRRFGVEIECNGTTASSIVDAFRRAGIEIEHEGYNHNTRPHWKLIYDSSVSRSGTGGSYGHEVVSPPLAGAAGKAELKRALEALREAGARVDSTCGLHVHHDMGGLTGEEMARVVEAWYANQNHFFNLIPASRRTASWCRPLREDEVTSIVRACRAYGTPRNGASDRYRALNVTAFMRHGTFEVRLHQGTLNTNKVLAWVDLFQVVVGAAVGQTDANLVAETTPAFLANAQAAGLDRRHARFLTARAESLAASAARSRRR